MVKHLKTAVFCLSLMLIAPSCTFVRFFTWNYADVNDNHKFPSVPVLKSEKAFSLTYAPANISIAPIPHQAEPVFENLLTKNKTLAFLILRNDSMLYEKYFDGYDAQQVIPSFSVSKVFVSALTGIAIEEGKIKNTEAVVTDYLTGMSSPGFNKIRIEDLLNMRSGIDFKESYSTPFSPMPKYYYGRHITRYAKHLKTIAPPDQHYEYQSVNTLLLSLMLEKAVQLPINQYLEEKLWKPMGMESEASWSIDSKSGNTVKSFCCLNAVARDYARFGMLYLHHGNWNGKQIVPAKWIVKTMSVINDSRDSQGYSYTYCWRVTPKGAIFAKGVLGQYIYVLPQKNIVIVRLGRGPGDINWAQLFEDLSARL